MTAISSIALAPLSLLYGAAAQTRRALYKTGIFRIHKIDAPVISVGNLTTGGTGKTPLVEWIARQTANEGKRVCILTRGYGRKQPGRRVVVSDGNSILADATTAGDEPLLLAENLLGLAAVICDADRVSAASWAQEHLRTEVFVLDDGFQYLRLARDLNIVVIDATNPWGGGHLLPRGRLREPPGALARADCIVITRADHTTPLESRVRQLGGDRPIIRSWAKIKPRRPLKKDEGQMAVGDMTLGVRVGAFCGIGNPQSFFNDLEREGYSLSYSRAFPDHHWYQQSDIDQMLDEARKQNASALVTTGKDAVKVRSLHFDLPCFVVEIDLEFDDAHRLREILREALAVKY
ncbi:MAG: tetraacyldisaccharide 4'-kinase [Pyrinomonadaceae bacterium]